MRDSLRPAAALLALVILTRVPFWPQHPPTFDFANFALGVERFAPEDHQPQPPGYPLVILLARIFAAAGFSVMHALLLTALAGGLVACLGAYRLGGSIGGATGGLFAAALFIFEPVVWYSGITSPARIYIAAAACWLLYFLMKLAAGDRRALWTFAALLALFAGFRPELLLFFALPFLIAARRAEVTWGRIAAAAALTCALCLPWAAWIAASFSSVHRMLYIDYYYFLHHVSTTSPFFGAATSTWHTMLRDSLLWNALPAALAVIALLASGKDCELSRNFWLPAVAYFLPAIVVQTLIHEGADAPDHSIGTITLLCVLAGALLGSTRRYAIAALALAAMLLLSFSKPGSLIRPLDLLSLRTVRLEQRERAAAIADLQANLQPGDAVVVLNGSPVSWRVLEYEFPQNVVLALDATIGPASAAPPTGWHFLHHRKTALEPGPIPLDACSRLHLYADPAGAQRRLLDVLLCARFPCATSGARLQVTLGDRALSTLLLGPYALGFVSR